MSSNNSNTPKQDGNNIVKPDPKDDTLGFEEISLADGPKIRQSKLTKELWEKLLTREFTVRRDNDGNFVEFVFDENPDAKDEADPVLPDYFNLDDELFDSWMKERLEAKVKLNRHLEKLAARLNDALTTTRDIAPKVSELEKFLLQDAMNSEIGTVATDPQIARGLARARPAHTIIDMPQKAEDKDEESKNSSEEGEAKDESVDAQETAD
ncbi:hypothetical protein F5Y04DRAFT_289168 [Hypomontagnella monticulosa]|nr:hypothetical protein F5Y04DRAFT_289168 [Hypomontagnella monticulosa]